MPEKLLVRVLTAVERGADTSASIAMAIHADRRVVARLLTDLSLDGMVERLQERCPSRGRPFYRYRLFGR